MIDRRFALTGAIVVAACMGVLAADKKVQLKNLPQAAQKIVAEEQSKGATLVGYSEEREDGKVFYEAETKVNGHTRDMLFDSAGSLVEVEEEIAAGTLPPAVLSTLAKHGKILKVESITKGSTVTYEAEVQAGGKKSEVVIDAEGREVKP